MRVLVTGSGGLLGSAVVEEFSRHGDVHAAPRAELDITDAAAVRRAVDAIRPDAIVNCAAYNDVDGAESHAVEALRLNALAVRAIAAAAREFDAALVHFGTDFVFDGEASRPYVEDDAVNPRGTYAASKLLGEWFAADAPRHYVLRVESLYGGPGLAAGARRGSLDTLVARIRAGEVAPVFVDRTVTTTYTPDIAAATRAVLERRLPPGIYHCVNDGPVSWRDVAEEAARHLGVELKMRELTLATLNAPAVRPRYSALSPARLASFGVVMPSWRDALARHLAGRAAAGQV
jgi:dTDP-4-dehydrorhamnose reductase